MYGHLHRTVKSKKNRTITKTKNNVNKIDFRKFKAQAIRHHTKVGQA